MVEEERRVPKVVQWLDRLDKSGIKLLIFEGIPFVLLVVLIEINALLAILPCLVLNIVSMLSKAVRARYYDNVYAYDFLEISVMLATLACLVYAIKSNNKPNMSIVTLLFWVFMLPFSMLSVCFRPFTMLQVPPEGENLMIDKRNFRFHQYLTSFWCVVFFLTLLCSVADLLWFEKGSVGSILFGGIFQLVVPLTGYIVQTRIEGRLKNYIYKGSTTVDFAPLAQGQNTRYDDPQASGSDNGNVHIVVDHTQQEL